MNDNLPAVPDPAPIAVADTDSWVEVMRPILALAEKIHDTDFVPRGLRSNLPATAAAMLYGREVGLPPMTSLNLMAVIEGKPAISAEGMRSLVLAAGHQIEVPESTGAMCHMRGKRRGSETWTPVVWTVDMARAAGLTGKGVWQKYPRAMLQARATTELCRLIFPDVIHGFRSIEELQDMSDVDTPAEGPVEPPTPRTRVARKTVGKSAKPAPAALEGPRPVEPMQGPPLPGEEGYEETSVVPGGASEPATGGSDTSMGHTGDAPPVAPPENAGTEAETPVTPSVPVPGTPNGGGSQGEGSPSPSGRKRSAAQHRMILAQLGGLGVDVGDRDERLHICSALIGRQLDSSSNLLATEATSLIDTLNKLGTDREKLDAFLDQLPEGGGPYLAGLEGVTGDDDE